MLMRYRISWDQLKDVKLMNSKPSHNQAYVPTEASTLLSNNYIYILLFIFKSVHFYLENNTAHYFIIMCHFA